MTRRPLRSDAPRSQVLAVRLFARLLALYPPAFRAAYGDEMLDFFLVRLERARARGMASLTRFWIRTAVDVVHTAGIERLTARPTSIPGDEPMSSFLNDLRYAARRLRRTPVFSLAAVTILAIGIGLNAVVFSLVDATLYRPVPYQQPERLVHVYQDSDDGAPSSTAFPAYRDMAAMDGVFSGVAATSSDEVTWERSEGPTSATIEFTTASYLPVLGLRPSRGRWFAPEHDVVGSEMVAVVSHRTWVTRMGADPGVIGQTVRLNNKPVTVIGVGPEKFNGEAGALVTDFWLSISSTPVEGPYMVANLDRREDHWYQVMARLAPGVDVAQARSAMTLLAKRLGEAYPEMDKGRGITVFGLDEVRFHPGTDHALYQANIGLFAVSGLILLLACANLANLLIVRGIARGPEMAVREALGAGRGRVARLMMLEALLLASLGGAAGLLIATWAVRLVPSLPIPSPGGTLDIGFDHRVLLFGVFVTAATALLCGILPAMRSAKADVVAALRDEGRGRSTGRGVSLLRGGLVVLQVAISMVLVVAAGLLARSLNNAAGVRTGVDADRIAVLGTNLQQGGVGDDARVVVAQILERIRALPAVENAALTSRLPVRRAGTTTQIVDGFQPAAGTDAVELSYAMVTPTYFETMGIPLRAGRAFSRDDRPNSPRVIIVNETAARMFWGGKALGGRIRSQGSQGEAAWRPVVGVVGDVKVNRLQEDPTPMIYYAAEQVGGNSFSIVVRTSGDPSRILGALRNAMHEVRPSLPVTQLTTLRAHLGDALAEPRAAAALLGGFSLLALLLASIGVYAVVSFSVERRTQELGIRVALGAPALRLIGTAMGDSLIAVGIGIGAGIVGAALSMRVLQGMLFGVGGVDQVTMAGAAVLLLAAAGAAAFIPARRAASADPADVLRGH